MRVHGGLMRLHEGLMGASWGPHESLTRPHGASWGSHESLMGPHGNFGCLMGPHEAQKTDFLLKVVRNYWFLYSFMHSMLKT